MTVNVYDGLIEWSEDYSELVPGLAESWEFSDDAKEWTFKLRTGVAFHDGTPFDEQAVKRSLEHFTEGAVAFALANMKRIDVSRPGEVRVLFSKPAPDFGRDQTSIKMVSPKLLAEKAAASERAVGTGRYKLVRWDKGSQMLLEAVPDHWSGEGPYLERIELRPINEQTTALSALTAGDIDLVMKVAPRQAQMARGERQVRHVQQADVGRGQPPVPLRPGSDQ